MSDQELEQELDRILQSLQILQQEKGLNIECISQEKSLSAPSNHLDHLKREIHLNQSNISPRFFWQKQYFKKTTPLIMSNAEF